jgi:hypothetical protein
MWIAKGTLLGLWLFSFGWLSYIARLYLIAQKLSGESGQGVFGIGILLPVSNLSFWLWLIACLAIGLLIARSWNGRPTVWIALTVTEIIPVGVLAMILMLVNRTRSLMK